MMNDSPSIPQDNLTTDEIEQKIRDLCNSKSELLRIHGIIKAYTIHYKLEQRSIMYTEHDILNEVIENLLTPNKYHWPRRLSKAPQAFILLSANRLCLELLRTKSWQWQSRGEYNEGDETLTNNSNPEKVLEAKDWVQKLPNRFDGSKLKEEVYWLKYVFGYTYKEISELVALSLDDVKAIVKSIQRAQAAMAAEVTL